MRKVTEDFIGTCQICFGEFKVNEAAKAVVLHGYQRPGDGAIRGECAGVGHQPFEYDCEHTKRLIADYHKRIATDQAKLDALQAGKVTSLVRYFKVYDKSIRREVEQSETVKPGDAHWDQTLRSAIYRREADIRWFTGTATYLQAAVDAWTRKPIIGIDVPATGKSRVLRRAYDPIEAEAAEKLALERAARAAKPGKLRLKLYAAGDWGAPVQDIGEAAWRKQYAEREAAEKAWLAEIKQWAKATFPGKLIVRAGYSSDLPRSIARQERGSVRYRVAILNLDWDHRDRVDTILPAAERNITLPKEVEFTAEMEKAPA